MDEQTNAIRGHLGALCLVLLAAVVSLPGGATAGECTATDQKSEEAIKNQLRIRNETLRDITVVFYRDHVSDEKKKKTQTIKPGKQAQYNFGVGGANGKVDGIARIEIGDTDVLECDANVSNTNWTGSDEPKTHWLSGGCVRLSSAGSVCLSCYSDCNKALKTDISGSDWQTTFIIKN